MRQIEQVHISLAETTKWPSLPTVLCYAWLTGVACTCLRVSLAWNAARQLKQRSRAVTDGPIIEQLRIQARLFGLRTTPKLLEAPGGGSPMLIGMFWPVIVIPSQTRLRLSTPEQTMVLGHELAHIRRGDLFWGLIASLIRAVFFFHPLVWLGERQLKLAQEIAADELAVVKQNHNPVEYGGLLVSVVGKLGLKMGSRPLLSTIALETAGPLHSLTRRLAAMSRIGRTSRRVVVCSGVLLGAVVLLGLVPWRLVAAEARDRAEQVSRFHQAVISIGGGKGNQNELQFSSPTLCDASRKGQHLYQAQVRVSEGSSDQPDLQSSAPTLHFASGQGAYVSSRFQNDKTRLWVVTLSAPDVGKPEEHTMRVTLLRNPSGKELTKEEQDGLVKMLYRTFNYASAWKWSKESQIQVPMPDGLATIQCNADAHAATDGPERIPECVLWRSPEISFASGATGTITMPRKDGSRLAIEVTVSKSNEPTRVAAESNKNDSQQLLNVPSDKLTLADYEAIPNPKSPFLGRKSYRMDGKTYGIVVQNDAKGETRVAGVNKSTGEWKWLEMPKNNQILFEPIMGDDVTAFILHGDPLSQLVVYNGRLNKWSTFPLTDRVIEVVPCVGDRMVGYQLANGVVAYYAPRDVWGMLRTDATIKVGDDGALVDTTDGRYEFPGKNGAWAAVKPSMAKNR